MSHLLPIPPSISHFPLFAPLFLSPIHLHTQAATSTIHLVVPSLSVSRRFGGLGTFFQGLDGLIGPPSPSFFEAMHREHCLATDSNTPFTTSNYSITTTSAVEYSFVADPEGGLQKLDLLQWPVEQDLRAKEEKGNVPRQVRNDTSPHPPLHMIPGLIPAIPGRQPMLVSELRRKSRVVDEKLKLKGCSALVDAEVIAGRLYTGMPAMSSTICSLCAYVPSCTQALSSPSTTQSSASTRACHPWCARSRSCARATHVHQSASSTRYPAKLDPAHTLTPRPCKT